MNFTRANNGGTSRQQKMNGMSVSSLRQRENRVREERYKQEHKTRETSAYQTGSPGSNGATVAPEQQTPDARSVEPARSEKKNRRLRWILWPLALSAVVGAVSLWIYFSQFESTDDAYITGHEHPVSFRVPGTISEVLIDDNQLMKQGDPIARLDPRDFEVALAQARANYLQAKAQLQQASAQIPLVQAQLVQAQAQADAAKANTDYLERTFQRNSQLFYQGRGVISKQDLDNSESQATTNVASYKASLAAVNVAKENLQVAQAQQQAAAAQVEAALAQVQNAELQLSYTTVYAPSDGRVSQKTFEVGQHVQAGQAGLAIAEPGVWVVANFKENQLGRIRPGQPVEIHVDAVSNHPFLGTVDSFQSGTGAVYALLPPDNATGNFTKIVQRVPVKIRFEPASIQGYEQLLVPGLSTEPKIRVR
jgi:membrane fusion protein (multidrug efflux system)